MWGETPGALPSASFLESSGTDDQLLEPKKRRGVFQKEECLSYVCPDELQRSPPGLCTQSACVLNIRKATFAALSEETQSQARQQRMFILPTRYQATCLATTVVSQQLIQKPALAAVHP
ncbi:uncharacterized protein AAG666_022636 isoform 1-T1 [Megaptera novaeangliae]